MNNKKKFADGLCFYKLFLIFIICSVLGSVYEELYNGIWKWFLNGQFEWSLRQGVIYGPFNIIYGFAAALMAKYLVPKKDKWFSVFIAGSLFGGLVEYGVSFFQEKLLGTVSWNYTGKLLNIDGRTTIPYMMFWGLCGMFVVYKLYPYLSKKIEEVPCKSGTIICNLLIIFMSFDMLISMIAVSRQTLRRQGIKPYTFIGEICDRYYTDEFLNKYYSTAEVVKK